MPTEDPSQFSIYTPGELRNIFDSQINQMEKELAVLLKYQLISLPQAKETRSQYESIYFKDGYAYIKEDLMNGIAKEQQSPEKIYRDPAQAPAPVSTPPSLKRFHLPDEDIDDEDDLPRTRAQPLPSGTIGISKSAIRDITGYSYMVKMPWHTTPVKIEWQQELIESDANIIVVDGSRQGGKSLTIAEKVIEESFIPGEDMMVCAFLQETTEAIGEYMIDYIENFEE